MTVDEPPRIPARRHLETVTALRKTPVLGIWQLTALLGVSHMTVRRGILNAFQELYDNRLAAFPGVKRLSSTLVMKTTVDNRKLPL